MWGTIDYAMCILGCEGQMIDCTQAFPSPAIGYIMWYQLYYCESGLAREVAVTIQKQRSVCPQSGPAREVTVTIQSKR